MAETATTPSTPGPPTSWLTTLLTHHVAVLALGGALGGGAVPVWQEVKAWRLGVAANQLQLVAEQERIWRRNASCLQEGSSSYEIDGPHQITIRVTLCSGTGDTLIKYHVGSWSPIYKWVSLPVEKVTKP